MNIVAIVQARTGSTRFPNKVFSNLSGYPLIWHVFNRLKLSKYITKFILATTTNPNDDSLEKWAIDNGISVFRGSENNVLSRFYYAGIEAKADIVVRITADDPFKDYTIIDCVIEMLLNGKFDFAYNNNPPSFPEGLDTEVFTMEALKTAFQNSDSDFEKEHVTQYFYRNKEQFSQQNFENDSNISYLRWTIDTELDFQMVSEVYNNLFKESEIFLTQDILNYLDKNPNLSSLNLNVKRSEMYK